MGATNAMDWTERAVLSPPEAPPGVHLPDARKAMEAEAADGEGYIVATLFGRPPRAAVAVTYEPLDIPAELAVPGAGAGRLPTFEEVWRAIQAIAPAGSVWTLPHFLAEGPGASWAPDRVVWLTLAGVAPGSEANRSLIVAPNGRGLIS